MNPVPIDPFNHWNTRVDYESVSQSTHYRLAAIINRYWDVARPDQEMKLLKDDRASVNWRVEIGGDRCFFKKSWVNDEESQDLVNRLMKECRTKGIPVPEIIPTKAGGLYQKIGRYMHTLYNFIEGEHFNGSEEELRQVAWQLALLHNVLAESTLRSEVEAHNRLVKHDREVLVGLLGKVRANGDKMPRYVREAVDKIDAASVAVERAGLENLYMQVIHNDGTPHNTHFEHTTHSDEKYHLCAIFDFDQIAYSQRIRDLAVFMHRHARTFGPRTEKRMDPEGDLVERSRVFLCAYADINDSVNPANPVTDGEVAAIHAVLKDDVLNKLIDILAPLVDRKAMTRRRYYRGTGRADYLKKYFEFDFKKHLTLLRESELLRFI